MGPSSSARHLALAPGLSARHRGIDADAPAPSRPAPGLRNSRVSDPARRVEVTTETAGTKGFLFCDLRGYSAFVEANGDRAAAELLETYRGLVRTVIAGHAGAEIRTEGDSVYVVFPTASAAVEAGLGIVAAAADQGSKVHPIRVGVGIHAGETVETDEGLVGSAVNIAARVCAKAQAGEVLVTETVRALTRSLLPYRFVGLGSQSLKGIPEGIGLYRVEATSTGRLAHLRRRLSARRRRVALAVGLLAVVLVTATAAWAVNRPADCLALSAATKDIVARIDPARGCVIATYPVGHGPDIAAWAGDKLWVANVDDRTITALKADGSPVATVGIGGPITAMAPDATDMWVLSGDDGTLTSVALESARVDGAGRLPGQGTLATANRIAEVRAALAESTFIDWLTSPDSEYGGLAVESGRVWVSARRTGQVVPDPLGIAPLSTPGPKTYQVDTAPEALSAACSRYWMFTQAEGGCPNYVSVSSIPFTGLIAVLGRTVWAAHQNTPDLAALDLDSASGIVSHLTVTDATGGATGLATVGDELWVVFHGGQVARVRSPQDIAVTDGPVASTLAAIAGDWNGIWVASADDHAVIRLDPTSLAVVGRVGVGGSASGVAVSPDGSVWATVR